MLERWGGIGVEPNALLNPDQPLLPPADGSPVDRVVARCGCGEAGCAALVASIRRVGDRVAWELLDRGAPAGIGPFEFAATAYERAVRRAHAERRWENRDERVARLVAEALWNRRHDEPFAFDWAASARPGAVVVAFTSRPRDPAERSATGSRQGGWCGISPGDGTVQHLGEFEISPGDDADAAARIVEQVTATEPGRWPRPRPSRELGLG